MKKSMVGHFTFSLLLASAARICGVNSIAITPMRATALVN